MVVAEIVKCRVCGCDLPSAGRHAGGNPAAPYCRCCAHDDGTARSGAEIEARLIAEAMTEDGLDYSEACAWALGELALIGICP